MNNDKNKQSQSDYQQNAQLGMIGLVAVGAVIWKNEDKIRLWFYQNTLYLALGGAGLLALIGLYLWHRFKKKEKTYFENLRKMRAIEANQSTKNYYQRKEPNERNFNR
ncbi:MAG: LPXTG cell wall anchor domain-containing protein [Bdellovibrionaceae bacterium]|nr:LPXTG cell wall anchor domain-containing protein [Pseudobdellovibrionaceae bacterium]NUM59951.1 LPXTG cell wall anchor domain-containing protein [Pseudobdellovibrionaceae bacterium]